MKKLIAFTFVAAIAAMICISCNQSVVEATTANQPISHDSLVKRGEYLVTFGGCNHCHTPKKFGPAGPEADKELLLSGHPSSVPIGPIDTAVLKNWVLFNGMTTAFVGPWGVSFAANLTSDSTGIGNWTEEQFVTALRHGKFKGLENNRMLLPPMPWDDMGKLTDEDINALFTYLKSTKPVKNVVPLAIPPAMLNKKG
ncbi:MAG: c-type cytochrome [Chitinophagaceae bacterium]